MDRCVGSIGEERGGSGGNGSSFEEGLANAEAFQHLLTTATNKLATNLVARIMPRFNNNHRDATLSQTDAKCQAGQAPANYGNRFHKKLLKIGVFWYEGPVVDA